MRALRSVLSINARIVIITTYQCAHCDCSKKVDNPRARIVISFHINARIVIGDNKHNARIVT